MAFVSETDHTRSQSLNGGNRLGYIAYEMVWPFVDERGKVGAWAFEQACLGQAACHVGQVWAEMGNSLPTLWSYDSPF